MTDDVRLFRRTSTPNPTDEAEKFIRHLSRCQRAMGRPLTFAERCEIERRFYNSAPKSRINNPKVAPQSTFVPTVRELLATNR